MLSPIFLPLAVFLQTAATCSDAPAHVMAKIVEVESKFRPNAIAIVGGHLSRQPNDEKEAKTVAQQLQESGINFSLGLAQINVSNFSRYGVDIQALLNPCTNLKVASKIFNECHSRAITNGLAGQKALDASYSCYYSGNFTTGFTQDIKGQPSYVEKIYAAGEKLSISLANTPAAQDLKDTDIKLVITKSNSQKPRANNSTGAAEKKSGDLIPPEYDGYSTENKEDLQP